MKTLFITCLLFTTAGASSPESHFDDASIQHYLRSSIVSNERDSLSGNWDKLKECLSHSDENSCTTSSSESSSSHLCTWCHAPGNESTGMCLPTMYATVAQCDQWDDMDTTCMMAALHVDGGPSAETCRALSDGEGNPCVYCHIFKAGGCLDERQATDAGRFLTCEKGESTLVA